MDLLSSSAVLNREETKHHECSTAHHVFHLDSETLLAPGPRGEGEGLAFSITWIVIALAFCAAAIIRRSTVFRWLGAATMTLAVGKVFLWDTRELDDLYRVASYLGLGVSLFALAWAMHRFMPRERSAEDERGEEDEAEG